MEAVNRLINRIDTLSMRERGMVFAGLIAAIYFSFDLFLYQPLATMEKQLENAIILDNAELATLNTTLQQLLAGDPAILQERHRQEVQQLRQELQQLDQELRSATANLVTPQQMADLLQVVLGQTSGLRLLRVTSLGSTPVIFDDEIPVTGSEGNNQPDGEEATDMGISRAYRHGLRVEFQGTYFTTLDYLKTLEGLESNFFWDTIDYQVNEYPEATAVLTLYTMGLDQKWIGI